MKKWMLVAFAALLPQLVFAQSGTLGSASSPVVNALGQAMGGVNVAVCGHPAAGGYPCSNLATVYTDISFATVLNGGNPGTTDPRGNWGFYVLPGQYDVEFYGAGNGRRASHAEPLCDQRQRQLEAV